MSRATKKIASINQDLPTSKGLTEEEAHVAAKAGPIAADQKWWWVEAWQKGERKAERDIKAGRVSGPFDTTEELLAHLHQL